MSGRDKMSAALFDAVGEIDDAFVAEAIEYKRIIKRKSLVKTLSAIAAAVLIVAAIAVPVVIGANFILSRTGGKNASPQTADTALTLSSCESLGFGTAALIWQKDGQEGYSYIVISDAQAKTLIEKVRIAPVSERSDTGIKVWIKFENGEYVSPQLKISNGNVGLTTFDYSPEIELSKSIADIINYCESGSE